MGSSYKLKKGLDLKMNGKSAKSIIHAGSEGLFGISPADFPGLTPKLSVKPGDKVLAGSPLFHDKIRPEVVITSPVSGTVKAINRGDRRKLMEIIVEKEGDGFVEFGKSDSATLSRESIKDLMLRSGLWPAVRQRPYHVIANPAHTPKAVFISGFDTAPLAPDLGFIADNSSSSDFYKGLSVLKKLTDGKLHLVLNGKEEASKMLKDAPGAEISYFSGPHPAGNVGVHIHHLDPLNKGEVIWIVNLQDVNVIGHLFNEGIYKNERVIALTGSEVINPQYYHVRAGISMESLTSGNLREGRNRIISGNVLTGANAGREGFLGFYDSQVTVIPEGDYFEFFGWLTPGLNKFSFSKTYLSSLLPKKSYRFDTNIHGGERAFVMTGLYEKVVPMDIYPMQLLKSILAGDIDMMENLGIYEIAEEDFALCEYVCPSKTEIQAIIRSGLDLMVKEMS